MPYGGPLVIPNGTRLHSFPFAIGGAFLYVVREGKKKLFPFFDGKGLALYFRLYGSPLWINALFHSPALSLFVFPAFISPTSTFISLQRGHFTTILFEDYHYCETSSLSAYASLLCASALEPEAFLFCFFFFCVWKHTHTHTHVRCLRALFKMSLGAPANFNRVALFTFLCTRQKRCT